MLKKLLKYDLKNMYKTLSIFYILAIVFAVLTRIFFSLKQTTIINIIGQICVGAMFAMIANIIINTLMRNWIRFKESVYGDESYLTHTLPIKKNTLYQSKFILSIITLLTAFVITIGSLLIAYANKENLQFIEQAIKNLAGSYEVSTLGFILAVITILFLELFSGLQAGILGIILGHKSNNNKVGKSVLMGFITYIASQVFVIISVFIIGIFNSDIMKLFTTNVVEINTIKTMIVISIIIYTIIIAIENMISTKLLKKGVNID